MYVPLQQRSAEWHAWRDQGITASEIPVVLGVSAYKTSYRLWQEKVGLMAPEDLSGNPYVQAGIDNEGRLRAHMESIDQTVIMPGCYAYDDDQRFRASLDGMSTEDVVYELKWPGEKTWNDVAILGERCEAYTTYRLQVQAQLLCAGADRAKLVFGRDGEDGIEVRVFEISRNDSEIDEILARGRTFLDQVASRTPPPKDPAKDLFEPDDPQRWSAVARQLRHLEARIVAATGELESLRERRDELLAPLIDEMGAFAKFDFEGVTVTRYTVDGSVNYKKIVADRLDLSDDELAAYRGRPSLRKRVAITPESPDEVTLDGIAVSGDFF